MDKDLMIHLLELELELDTLLSVHRCYLPKQTACLCAKPKDLVRRCSDQQVFSGSRREADLQRRIKVRALNVQDAHIYVEQLDRDSC